jgi:phospholipase/carboxylesterase
MSSSLLVGPPQATHALICLHGFGANGHDLLGLAEPLQSTLGKLGETLAVFCPTAPAPTPQGLGFQWFRDMGWTFRDPPGIAAAAALLGTYIERISENHAIAPANIALLGFSQGSMTSLYALPGLTHAPAAVISCSGGLTVQPTIPADAPPTTPILFLHGLADDVWPADATVAAEAFFRQHGYPTQLELIEGLPHGIDARCLAHIAVFLQHIWQPSA